MQFDGVEVISPLHFTEEPWSEPEVLGGMVWLWGLHDYYKQGSVEAALNILKPILRSKRFCFFVANGQPLGYINWSFLSEPDEEAYVKKTRPYEYFLDLRYPPDIETRLWMLSYFFPAGGNLVVKNILRNHLFKDEDVYLVYHKTPHGSPMVKKFSGSMVRNK